MTSDSDWQAAGKCQDHPAAIFFPRNGVGVEVARRICAECPVQEACLEYALADPVIQGVWGGTSERQRRGLRRQRAAARSSA